LGLSIAKNFVEEMGGELAFVSQVGVGTTFFFTLALELSTDVSFGDKNTTESTMQLRAGSPMVKIQSVSGSVRAWNPASIAHGEQVNLPHAARVLPGMMGSTSPHIEASGVGKSGMVEGLPEFMLVNEAHSSSCLTVEIPLQIDSRKASGDSGASPSATGADDRSPSSGNTSPSLILSRFSASIGTSPLLPVRRATISGLVGSPGSSSVLFSAATAGIGSPTRRAATLRLAAHKQGPVMRVLVVDDISTNRLLLKRILKNIAGRLGIPAPVILTAKHGREAVDLVAATYATGPLAPLPFHLIFLDRQMPSMDGVEAARLIKELQTKHVKVGSAQSAHVVGMSASIDTGGKWLAAGVDELMEKPCPVSDLEKLMQFIVSTRVSVPAG
jgi:CheY-like chemotaxis protein